MSFERVNRAIEKIAAGKMVILVDDEDRENEGDLFMAADLVTAEAVNFMARYGRGLICLTLTPERLEALQVPMMVQDNTSRFGTAFTVSIEARTGVSTGISAADRARTIQVAVDPASRPQDLARPGHIFPLRAQPGGVLVRSGQTEGSVDLARLAGRAPAGVICEVMNDDGTMARRDDLRRFGQQHDLCTVSVAELIAYRLAHETLVHELQRVACTHPRFGAGTLHVFGTALDGRQHLAWVRGPAAQAAQAGSSAALAPLVRVEGGAQPHEVLAELTQNVSGPFAPLLAQLAAEPAAALVCLQAEQPGPSLAEQVAALSGPAPDGAPPGTPSTEAGGVLRQLGVGAQILRVLGLTRIRLVAGQARRLAGLDGYGLHVDDVVPPATAPANIAAESPS